MNLGTSVGRSTATPSTSLTNSVILHPALDAYMVLTSTGSEQRERPSKSDGERLVDNFAVNIHAIANLRSHYRAYFETDVRRYTVLDAVRPTTLRRPIDFADLFSSISILARAQNVHS